MIKQKTTNKSFSFGLLIGIAIVAVIGFAVVLGMYLKQDKYEAGDDTVAAVENTDVKKDSAPVSSKPESEVAGVKPAEVKVSKNDRIRGNLDAPITIVEFSDFQCSYCGRFHQTMQQVVDSYPDQVRWVYKHFPLDSIHPYAREAAEASECAGDQGKFWEFADALYLEQSEINSSFIKETAQKLGLDTAAFDQCLDSDKYSAKVEADYQEGIKAGVRGTPGNFINGQPLPGAVPYEQIKSSIDALLE